MTVGRKAGPVPSKVGSWTVVGRAGSHKSHAVYDVVCRCGETALCTGTALRAGRSKRCSRCSRAALHHPRPGWQRIGAWIRQAVVGERSVAFVAVAREQRVVVTIVETLVHEEDVLANHAHGVLGPFEDLAAANEAVEAYLAEKRDALPRCGCAKVGP